MKTVFKSTRRKAVCVTYSVAVYSFMQQLSAADQIPLSRSGTDFYVRDILFFRKVYLPLYTYQALPTKRIVFRFQKLLRFLHVSDTDDELERDYPEW